MDTQTPAAAARGGAPEPGDLPVTVVVTRRVKPGHEAAYERALAALQSDAAGLPGYLGATTQRPAPGAPAEYTSVFRFANVAHLRVFEASARRASFLEEVRPHVEPDPAWRELTGLEFWFGPPAGAVVPQPVRWRMALVMVVVVYGLVLGIGGAVGWLLGGWPAWARLLVTIVVEVALMTWWLMPWLTRRLAPWIFPRRVAPGR
ncbi:MAG: antibiotic biosynthesis monooxygenase [Rubrivivax sp.]|nr:antibiotic biosynthesis monooxygenase [Rubrivivax sp.]